MGTSLSPQQISERLAKQFAQGVAVHLPPGKGSSQLAIVERDLLPEVLSVLKFLFVKPPIELHMVFIVPKCCRHC